MTSKWVQESSGSIVLMTRTQRVVGICKRLGVVVGLILLTAFFLLGLLIIAVLDKLSALLCWFGELIGFQRKPVYSRLRGTSGESAPLKSI